ncbi:MAG TPA: metallopeptidase TldD-related protein [Candidatus Limnocylindria bacterium]|nr:metallopeptidase TldD-related protein [Candidatus Limnocylindria bacterium]
MSGLLFGESELRDVAQRALKATQGDQAEAIVIGRTNSLTRYANAAIHQNVTSREAEVRVRVVVGKRYASATTNRLDEEGLRRAAAAASDLARRAPEDPTFGGLPAPRPIPPAPSAYIERTAEATPLDRARAVKLLCDAARAAKLVAAGFVATNVQEVAVASTTGTWAYSPQTHAEVQIAAIGDDGSAFAHRVAPDFSVLDVEGAGHEAVTKAVRAQHPRDAEPGTYEVVLEPYAVRDMVGFLGGHFTGLAVEEGRSFVGGKLGEQVTGPITLVDDPFDPQGIPRAFDFEGQPSDRVTLLERGIARAIVYDSGTAHRAGVKNTGHALPPNPFMPAAAMHARVEAGDASHEQLVAGVKKGLLVTRFHYTRWVHQLRTIVTGMTRDGTFAIENGEVTYPIKNLRFTQSYHEAWSGVRAIGKDLRLLVAAEQFGLTASCQRVPALHLAAFTFTGATRY